MIYRKFRMLKSAIDEGNVRFAKYLVASISENDVSLAGQSLLLELENRIPKTNHDATPQSYSIEPATLAEYDSSGIAPGISIVSCCMNRNANLLRALQTWIKLPVDEIVIVDWSSSLTVSESIKEINDDRIKVLRVNGEAKWILTYAFNVGLRFARYSRIFKFDADIEVTEDFLELNYFDRTQFIRGNWKSALDEGLDSQIYVNGSFGASKNNLKEIGYYNELITTYGWDDSDLYERLASQCGLGSVYLDLHSIMHLEQEEAERIVHQDVLTSDFLGLVRPTDFHNQRNKFIGRNADYWNSDRLQNYSIKKSTPVLWTLERLTQANPIPAYLINDANTYAAIHHLYASQADVAKKSMSPNILAKFILCEYEAKVHYELTQTFLGEISHEHNVRCFDGKQSYKEFLSDCIGLSGKDKCVIYAVALGDCYSHKRMGDANNFVELLVLPPDLFEVTSAHRVANKMSPLAAETASIALDEVDDNFAKLFDAKVYVDVQHGLGNRIRAIGSAAAIAARSQRELVIVWEADHHCECEFNDLFDYSGKVFTRSFIGEAHKTMDVYNYMEIEHGAVKDRPIEVNADKHLYLRSAYTFNSPLSDWSNEDQFIKELRPSKQVLDLIAPFKVDGYIAAHIRMEAGAGLDSNTYDSIENWTQEGHNQLQYWREKSHYSVFLKRIDELIELDSTLKLFLATDLQETYDIFEQYYGERLVYLKRKTFDRSKEQMIYALADMLLLSRCQKLLGSTWSSFSEAAMRLSNTYSKIEMSGKDF